MKHSMNVDLVYCRCVVQCHLDDSNAAPYASMVLPMHDRLAPEHAILRLHVEINLKDGHRSALQSLLAVVLLAACSATCNKQVHAEDKANATKPTRSCTMQFPSSCNARAITIWRQARNTVPWILLQKIYMHGEPKLQTKATQRDWKNVWIHSCLQCTQRFSRLASWQAKGVTGSSSL